MAMTGSVPGLSRDRGRAQRLMSWSGGAGRVCKAHLEQGGWRRQAVCSCSRSAQPQALLGQSFARHVTGNRRGLLHQAVTARFRRFLFLDYIKACTTAFEGGGERTARSCERAAGQSLRVTKAFWQCFRKWGGPVREFRKLSELD